MSVGRTNCPLGQKSERYAARWLTISVRATRAPALLFGVKLELLLSHKAPNGGANKPTLRP